MPPRQRSTVPLSIGLSSVSLLGSEVVEVVRQLWLFRGMTPLLGCFLGQILLHSILASNISTLLPEYETKIFYPTLITQSENSGRLVSWMDLLKTVDLASVFLRIYGNSASEFNQYRLAYEHHLIVDDKLLSRSKPNVFFIHGYIENADSYSVRAVITALAKTGDYNLVALDWSKLANMVYPIPAFLCRRVAAFLAQHLDMFNREGVFVLSKTHLIGNSLGAHLAGFVGKYVSGGRLKRITGLDPAYPLFFVASQHAAHLAPSDAMFVDVIHTDQNWYGVPYTTGHADFYPNGGTRFQPGCPVGLHMPLTADDFCSHWRSWMFFVESINGDASFVGRRCKNLNQFIGGECAKNEKAVMGMYAKPETRGVFVLRTRDRSPYALDEEGADVGSSTGPGEPPGPAATTGGSSHITHPHPTVHPTTRPPPPPTTPPVPHPAPGGHHPGRVLVQWDLALNKFLNITSRGSLAI